MAKRYLTLTDQLHEGKNVCLSQLILGSLYASLGEAIESLRNIKPKDGILLVGLFWLLQLLLNATFETLLKTKCPYDADPIISDRRVEGT